MLDRFKVPQHFNHGFKYIMETSAKIVIVLRPLKISNHIFRGELGGNSVCFHNKIFFNGTLGESDASVKKSTHQPQ